VTAARQRIPVLRGGQPPPQARGEPHHDV
jgi:hypothetical protein